MPTVHALITTKLQRPLPRPDWVARSKLVKRLNEAICLGQRLLLVSAPVGCGKTTLIAAWLDQAAMPSVWVSLDDDDNDPARFVAYLYAGVRSAQAPGRLEPPPPGFAIGDLINTINALDRPLIVVLDDYHVIHNAVIHAGLAFLLERMPAQVHLAVLTRADPALPVPRWRARGQVLELRLEDLRFNVQEAADLIKRSTGTPLTGAEIEALTERTEGWVAGLQIAATSLRGQVDPVGFIRFFTGRHRHLLDFFVTEVFERQPREIQEFLLNTALVDRLCAPLGDALCGPPLGDGQSAQTTLDYLDHANLFILPLDPQRQWYRYHRLFADLLRQQLHQRYPQREAELHQRASGWWAENGFPDEAIDHALLAGHVDRAADLIETCAEATLMRSEIATFNGWMGRLPAGTVDQRPTLLAYHSWSLLWSGAALDQLAPQIRRLNSAGDPDARGAPFQAFLAAVQGQGREARQFAELALARLPAGARLLRNLAQFMLASGYLAEGDTPNGMEALERASQSSERAGHIMLAVLALCGTADLRRRQGRLRDSEALLQHALRLATDAEGRPLAIAGRALVALADLARERNDLDGAQALIDQGNALFDHVSPFGSFNARLVAAQLAMAKDDLVTARREADLALTQAARSDYMAGDDRLAEMVAARVAIAASDLISAHRWAQGCGLEGQPRTPKPDPFSGRLHKYEALVAARLWLAEGDAAQVIDVLGPTADELASLDRNGLLLECLALLALAHWHRREHDQAQDCLQRSLMLAEAEGYQRLYLDLGETMRIVLAHAQPRLTEPRLRAYAARLLGAFEPRRARSAILIDPLSEREREILPWLASELSIRELAARLLISENTLRTHLKSIYAKLGAHSRYEAVVRAREIDLLNKN